MLFSRYLNLLKKEHINLYISGICERNFITQKMANFNYDSYEIIASFLSYVVVKMIYFYLQN